MPDQQETLRIKVDLDTSQATRNLQVFQQAASQVGSTLQHTRNQAKPQIEEWQKAVANLSKEALGVGRVFGELTKIMNPWVLGVGLIGYELYRQLNVMKEWARNMTEMGNSARMAGLRLGEFRSISDQLRQAGVSAQSAQSLIQNFSRAYAELMQPGSERRAQLFAMGGAQFASGMTQTLVKLSTLTTETQRLNYIRHAGLNVYANEFARTHDKQLATYKEELFLQLFGAQELINRQTDFKELTEEQLKRQDKMQADAAELNAALEREKQTREEIFNLTFGWTTKFETKIVDLGHELEEQVLDQLHQMQSGNYSPWATPEHPASAAPGLQPGKTKEDWSRVLRPQRFEEGGLQADPLIPKDPADVLGLAPGSLGYGNIAKDWRRSGLVEDDRDQVQAVDTNTKEFHDLNQRIERLLDTGVFGKAAPVPMAKGGVVKGPVHALVGEAGPEAIVTRHGAGVVDQPTHALLGGDGPAAVIPLGPEKLSQAFKGSGAGEAYTSGDVRAAIGAKLDPNVPTDILAQARHVALSGGPGAVDAFMKAQGTPQPGDIAVAIRQRAALTGGKPIKTGDTGSHIAFVQDYDAKTDRITGFGGNQASWEAGAPAKGFTYYRPMAEGGLVTGPESGMAASLRLTTPPAALTNFAKAAAGAVTSPLTTAGNYLGGLLQGTERFHGAEAVQAFAPLALTAVGGLGEIPGGLAAGGLKGAVGSALEGDLTGAGEYAAIQGVKQLQNVVGNAELGDPTATVTGKGIAGGLRFFSDVTKAPSNPILTNLDRAAIDRSARGGTIEGTVNVEHQEQPASAKGGRSPLFRSVQINRQSQMAHAAGGPATTFSQDEAPAH